jgi:hypothetical protein
MSCTSLNKISGFFSFKTLPNSRQPALISNAHTIRLVDDSYRAAVIKESNTLFTFLWLTGFSFVPSLLSEL